ncbi:MAG: methylmalonyl-CoA epimerase [Bacillota bacterium]|nr:methylmalonyl-CoA epimerase [Bacillota bacterium]
MSVERPALDHIGVAVDDLEAALPRWGALGLAAVHVEEVAGDRVRVALLPFAGGGRIELLEPTDPAGPVGRFLSRRGAGLHHVALRVADIRRALREAVEAGLEAIDAEPRRGAEGQWVAFLKPAGLGGVLVELCQKEEEA